jgi:ParB family chromosome partitioning protein
MEDPTVMAAPAKKKSQNKGLGRGLDALLGPAPSPAAAPEPGLGKTSLPIERIYPRAGQPRERFAEEAIAELAASIEARGLLQPILVRPGEGGAYEIVAGERRWRAAQRAKLHNVPVIIRELTDEETAEIALIENVQRVDLNPIEEARAYARLAGEYKRTQEDIARAVGKSRSHVANVMRLLNLPAPVQDAVGNGAISMGHARALLGATSPKAALAIVLERGFSVRQTEDFIRMAEARLTDGRAGKARKNKDKSKASNGAKDADTRALERDLSQLLGLEVEIDHSKKGAGALTIRYLTIDQLDDICRRLMGASV